MHNNFPKYSLVVFCVGLALSTAALAKNPMTHFPEIDSGMAVSALTLMAGSLAVLRIRRKK